MTDQPRPCVLLYRADAISSPHDESGQRSQSPQDLNRLVREAGGDFLALAPVGSRLPEGLLERGLGVLASSPWTQAVYPAHTAGHASMRPLLAQGAFRPASLLRRNAVGPVSVLRRSAWEELGGLRTGLAIPMALWDFWLRLALAHPAPDCILRLPGQLVRCPAQISAQTHGDGRADGKAKALLVVHTPGAFEGDVCRWAMALLRGDSWARPHAPGLIPTAAEVRRMWESGRRASHMGLRQSA